MFPPHPEMALFGVHRSKTRIALAQVRNARFPMGHRTKIQSRSLSQ